jgi:gamma-glutamylcyclotransferase (GGCT)/AIG2-like uncharacterized protein YtfP
MEKEKLAVNRTLMRGLALNPNLLAAGGKFVEEAKTSSCYRLWSIGDRHPAMLGDESSGVRISVEIWQLTPEGLLKVLQ